MSVIYARFIQFISLHRWIKSVQFKQTRSVMGLFGNENTYNYVHFKTQIVLYRFKAVVSGSFNKVLVSAIQKKKRARGEKFEKKEAAKDWPCWARWGHLFSFITLSHFCDQIWKSCFPNAPNPLKVFLFITIRKDERTNSWHFRSPIQIRMTSIEPKFWWFQCNQRLNNQIKSSSNNRVSTVLKPKILNEWAEPNLTIISM